MPWYRGLLTTSAESSSAPFSPRAIQNGLRGSYALGRGRVPWPALAFGAVLRGTLGNMEYHMRICRAGM